MGPYSPTARDNNLWCVGRHQWGWSWHDRPPPARTGPRESPGPSLPWLGWLACCALPWLGLAWACLACLTCNNNRPPSAAGGGCAAAVVVAGKAGKTGPGQTKPRQGTTSKPAKPSQGVFFPTPVDPTARSLQGQNMSPKIAFFHFWGPKWSKKS